MFSKRPEIRLSQLSVFTWLDIVTQGFKRMLNFRSTGPTIVIDFGDKYLTGQVVLQIMNLGEPIKKIVDLVQWTSA